MEACQPAGRPGALARRHILPPLPQTLIIPYLLAQPTTIARLHVAIALEEVELQFTSQPPTLAAAEALFGSCSELAHLSRGLDLQASTTLHWSLPAGVRERDGVVGALPGLRVIRHTLSASKAPPLCSCRLAATLCERVAAAYQARPPAGGTLPSAAECLHIASAFLVVEASARMCLRSYASLAEARSVAAAAAALLQPGADLVQAAAAGSGGGSQPCLGGPLSAVPGREPG